MLNLAVILHDRREIRIIFFQLTNDIRHAKGESSCVASTLITYATLTSLLLDLSDLALIQGQDKFCVELAQSSSHRP